MTFDTSGTGSSGPERRKELEAFYGEALERANGLPGVRVASLSSLGPMSGDDSTRALFVPGFEALTRDDRAVHLNSIGTRFFETMGIPLVKGREFTSADDAKAPKVAILNETAARFYFAGLDPLGQTVHMGWDNQSPPMQVVGVVRDSKRQDLRQPAPRMLYLPFLQYHQPYMTLEIRTTADPTAVASSVRQAFREINRDIPVREIKTLQTQIDQGLVQERLVATLSSFFGLSGVAPFRNWPVRHALLRSDPAHPRDRNPDGARVLAKATCFGWCCGKRPCWSSAAQLLDSLQQQP